MPHTGTSVILWALINLADIAAVRVYEAYSAIITKVYGKHGVIVQGSLEQDRIVCRGIQKYPNDII
jgi:hypothetical protein